MSTISYGALVVRIWEVYDLKIWHTHTGSSEWFICVDFLSAFWRMLR